MEIVNETELHDFCRRHSNARRPAANWIQAVNAARWRNFVDVRSTFGSADLVSGQVIFDLGGNNFRVIALIDYPAQTVSILEVMTHAEYDRWRP